MTTEYKNRDVQYLAKREGASLNKIDAIPPNEHGDENGALYI
jgi:hypothetical protein